MFLLKKRVRPFTGFNQKYVSLYSISIFVVDVNKSNMRLRNIHWFLCARLFRTKPITTRVLNSFLVYQISSRVFPARVLKMEFERLLVKVFL